MPHEYLTAYTPREVDATGLVADLPRVTVAHRSLDVAIDAIVRLSRDAGWQWQGTLQHGTHGVQDFYDAMVDDSDEDDMDLVLRRSVEAHVAEFGWWKASLNETKDVALTRRKAPLAFQDGDELSLARWAQNLKPPPTGPPTIGKHGLPVPRCRCGSATHKRMNSRACPLNKAVLREKAARAAAFAGGSAGGDDAISMLLSPASAAASASSSSSSSARWPSTNAAGELYYRRPAGRPPNGKAWNSASGVWVMKDPNDPTQAKPTRSSGSSSSAAKKALGKGVRPRGRAPAGSTWNYAEGGWEYSSEVQEAWAQQARQSAGGAKRPRPRADASTGSSSSVKRAKIADAAASGVPYALAVPRAAYVIHPRPVGVVKPKNKVWDCRRGEWASRDELEAAHGVLKARPNGRAANGMVWDYVAGVFVRVE